MPLRIHTNAAMSYSFFVQNQPARYSQTTGRQPVLTGQVVCTDRNGQDWLQGTDTTFFCSMKNPRKSPGIPAGIVAIEQANLLQTDMDDLPFTTPPLPMHRELPTPQEESFRALVRDSLPRHTAPQALQDRIRRSIKNMPD